MISEKSKTDARVGMSLEDYMREANEKPFEIINGERLYKMPPLSLHGWILKAIFKLLDDFARQHHLGVMLQEITFIRPNAYDSNWVTGSRVPDIMFYTGSRISDYFREHPDWQSKPFLIAPDLIVEIISPNDTFSQLDEKVNFDFSNGVKVVWLIDPNRRKAWVYTPDDDSPKVFLADGVLTEETLLPNFKLELAKIWA